MYVVSFVIILLTAVNYFFSIILYKEPSNLAFYNNVRKVDNTRERYVLPEPKYVLMSSVVTGVMIGLYLSYAINSSINRFVIFMVVLILSCCYLTEISRKISVSNDKVVLSKFFSKRKEIALNDISGMYIYSYNKKFIKQHALTTKLVIAKKNNEKIKFIMSSFSNRKVLNLMKDCFGIEKHRIFFEKR